MSYSKGSVNWDKSQGGLILMASKANIQISLVKSLPNYIGKNNFF
jgi:hypothetical protein